MKRIDQIAQEIPIGGGTWKIVYNNNLNEEETPLAGCCMANSQEIHLNAYNSAQAMEKAFVHEMLHAVMRERGSAADKKYTEEEFVSALDPLLTQVIRHLIKISSHKIRNAIRENGATVSTRS